MNTLLLTAFEPFDGEALNPSCEVAKAIATSTPTIARVETLMLPVDRFTAIEIALGRVRESKPDAVMMLGEAGRRFRVNPERVAINVDDFRIPDNKGNQPKGEAIVEGGPAGYFSTLAIYAIVDTLIEANIPAMISDSAGTYLCNRLFYSVMHFITVERLPIKAGFIHLPYMHEQTVGKRLDFPSLSRPTLIEAIRLAIEVTFASKETKTHN
jgi:pyroglutamyl-peptidase